MENEKLERQVLTAESIMHRYKDALEKLADECSVIVDTTGDCFEATSPDYPGFSATGPSKEGVEDQLRRLIGDCLTEAFWESDKQC